MRFMLWLSHREHDARPIEPSCTVNTRRAQSEAAKGILAETFSIRPNEVEEMIHRRIEEEVGLGIESERTWLKMVCGLRLSMEG